MPAVEGAQLIATTQINYRTGLDQAATHIGQKISATGKNTRTKMSTTRRHRLLDTRWAQQREVGQMLHQPAFLFANALNSISGVIGQSSGR